MPPDAATSVASAGVSGDLGGFGATQGRDEGTTAVASNPREGTAQTLADAVMSALRAGDLVAAHAAAKALEAFVVTLGKVESHAVTDIRAEWRSRGNNTA